MSCNKLFCIFFLTEENPKIFVLYNFNNRLYPRKTPATAMAHPLLSVAQQHVNHRG
jgi:hypothetical protein